MARVAFLNEPHLNWGKHRHQFKVKLLMVRKVNDQKKKKKAAMVPMSRAHVLSCSCRMNNCQLHAAERENIAQQLFNRWM